ncbi:Non-heme 11 kDa protein of cytochrome bc1 complex [Mycena latifolia]|nr:Non-heme 11 kDa protein of cytochrome bc1 complex [Mycena latifolia]
MSGIGSFLSSFFPTVHADAAEEKPADDTQAASEDAAAEEPKEEEAAEEEEPEDEHPAIRAACEERADCAPLKHHFEKCQEKVQAGEGFKGEDCVEEIVWQVYVVILLCAGIHTYPTPRLPLPVHMMHCSEACAAPQLFAKLR